MGYAIVVFSNQSGVARGMFDESAVHAVNARLDEMLLDHDHGAIIDRHEFCPFHPEGTVEEYRKESPLRKPLPGMILQAADKLQLDVPGSWVIGDAPRDIEAGKSAGCRTILFTLPNAARSPAATAASTVVPDYTVSSLTDAVATIARYSPGRVAAPADPPAAERAIDPPATPAAPSLARTELLLQQILDEFRRHREIPPGDFAVTKLLAGVTQVLALAVLFLAYLYKGEVEPYLLVAIFLQCFTIALLIMGKQR
jgi:histidinol-phosphate phosphatase family protein